MAEPQRLAQFLRERCARNQYGLRYLNKEQTLLLIPWPVVQRPTEEQPVGFQMFHEWAGLSFRKRGNNEAAEQRETPTQQKHRFRNALARANGIVYRKEIKMDGARVYEFVDSKRAGSSRPSEAQSPFSQDGSSTDHDWQDDDYTELFDDSSPNNGFTNGYYLSEPLLLTPGSTPVSQSSPTLNDIPPMPVVNPSSPFMNNLQPNGHNLMDDISVEDITDVIEENSQGPLDPNLFDLGEPLPVTPHEQVQDACMNPTTATDQSELEIKLRFRDDEAMRCYVTNRDGCRIYYGKNIPDLSLLLEKEHLQNLMSIFRYPKHTYFGPESLQQIQLPRPHDFMKSPVQTQKSEQILVNMDRGLILYTDHNNAPQQMSVPDVYAMRLCQTRIFPHRDSSRSKNGFRIPADSLKRMEWTKVFDGKFFCEQFVAADQLSSVSPIYPSPSFSFSLGVRPPMEEPSALLVSVTVTVQKAQQIIQTRLDNDRQEICISGFNSVDMEAQALSRKLTEILTL